MPKSKVLVPEFSACLNLFLLALSGNDNTSTEPLEDPLINFNLPWQVMQLLQLAQDSVGAGGDDDSPEVEQHGLLHHLVLHLLR